MTPDHVVEPEQDEDDQLEREDAGQCDDKGPDGRGRNVKGKAKDDGRAIGGADEDRIDREQPQVPAQPLGRQHPASRTSASKRRRRDRK